LGAGTDAVVVGKVERSARTEARGADGEVAERGAFMASRRKPASGGRAGPHVFVADVRAPVLDLVDHHHLARVLRLRSDELFTISDGAGAWRTARWTGDETPEVVSEVRKVPPPVRAVMVGFALVKGDRPELVVQKLTELGVDVIVPFVAERSVVRWDEAKATTAANRLSKVAREAAMQCRRCHLPRVEPLAAFDRCAGAPGVVLAERGGPPPSPEVLGVIVGPEGGWTPDELRGRPTVGLGDHVLRAETAAITAGVLLTALRAGRVAPVDGLPAGDASADAAPRRQPTDRR
jgi:16S rRNA (uracil1498-N3)-methyltransferase